MHIDNHKCYARLLKNINHFNSFFRKMGTVSIEKELVKLESMVPALKNKENEMVGLFHNH